MEPATDTELLYHTIDLDALVRKYSRNLQDERKDDVIIQKAKYHISVL